MVMRLTLQEKITANTASFSKRGQKRRKEATILCSDMRHSLIPLMNILLHMLESSRQ